MLLEVNYLANGNHRPILAAEANALYLLYYFIEAVADLQLTPQPPFGPLAAPDMNAMFWGSVRLHQHNLEVANLAAEAAAGGV